MEQQLTTEQITAIDNFVKDCYVQYDDVRLEIVDHLATEIEAEQINRPDETFSKVMYEVVSKHGPELKLLVKRTQRNLRWYWMKKMMTNGVRILFSFYFLVPLIVYFLVWGLDQFLSFRNLAVVLIFIAYLSRRFFLKQRDQDKFEMEGRRFLELGTLPIMCALASFFLILDEFAYKSLEDYYDMHPTINKHRKAIGF